MVAKVMLTITEGTQRGRKFVLDHPDHLVIGREDDCAFQLAGRPEYQLVSRHHCELDFEPPVVRVRDLGSLNGTYVNGNLVGRRQKWPERTDATEKIDSGYLLGEGDELRVGPVAFRIHLDVPE